MHALRNDLENGSGKAAGNGSGNAAGNGLGVLGNRPWGMAWGMMQFFHLTRG